MATEQPMGMRRAALWQFGSKFASIAAQLVITMVLARLITPEQFGVLAIVSVFLAFFQLFSDMGIGVAVVQFQDLDEREHGALFSFTILLAVGLAAVFCATAVPIAAFYGQPDLVPLFCLAAASLVFTVLNTVPNGLMLKDLQFKSIAWRLVVATVVSGVVAIGLAFGGWGAYALVMQAIMNAAIVFAWNFARRPIRHVTVHFMPALRKVFSYSAFQFGFNLVNYFNRNLDNLVIGRVLGAAALGFYDKAYRLTTYPMTSFSMVIASIIQPYMARHQDEPDVIFRCWLKIEKLLSLVGAPIAALFFLGATEIIAIAYGDQWGAAVPIFQALSISVYFQMLGNPSGAFFQSANRTDLMFRVGLINTGITVAALAVGLAIGVGMGGAGGAGGMDASAAMSQGGQPGAGMAFGPDAITAVAWCIAAAFCLHIAPLFYFLLHRVFGQSARCLVRFAPELVTSAVAVALWLVCSRLIMPALVGVFAADVAHWVGFGICVALLMAVYLVGYALTGQFAYIKDALNLRSRD